MGMEGIFGGEKHTRETYESAKEESVTADTAINLGTLVEESLRTGTDVEDIGKIFSKRSNEARQRVEKLYGKGQAEAIALNKEYDGLIARAQEATKAVEDFEKEKLGM